MGYLFMGVDIGTSGVRAALFDMDGNQKSLYHQEYLMKCHEEGMAELDPDEIFGSLLRVVKECMAEAGADKNDIAAIGLSTQLFSFLAVDGAGNCLTNLITWADNRSIRYAERIRENFDCREIYNRTGCRVQHPMYPISKILWLKDTQPEIFKKVKKFITIKQYIVHRLFNEYVIDITDASSMGYFNIHRMEWDESVLKDVLGLDSGYFGTPVECTHVLRNIKEEYAVLMGITAGTPVVVASGDGMLANVGCGVFDDSSMSSTIGTSGALRIASEKPLLDSEQRTWCYCFTKDTWVAGGAINNGGIVLKWLRDDYKSQYEKEMLDQGMDSIYKLFDRYASQIAPGCQGLIFLPFLTGERSPNWNASAAGTIHGLRLMHGKRHFIRAAMEGIMFRMFSVYEVITQITSNVKQIRANGGYANSEVWLQMQADIFNKEIAVAGVSEAAAFGAAYVAMAAVGAVNSLKQPLKCMDPQKIIRPITENNRVYMDAYGDFKNLYAKIYGSR